MAVTAVAVAVVAVTVVAVTVVVVIADREVRLAVDGVGRVAVADDLVRDRVRHLPEHLLVVVVEGVAGLLVAGVVRRPGGPAVDRGLLRRLELLGAGEQ